MNNIFRFFTCCFLIFAFITSALPCGPEIVAPLFDYKHAPENPYENFAAGKLGIIKPEYHRSVLYAAYRYLNNGAFTAGEQKALTEVWNAEFNNREYTPDDVGASVKQWVEQRRQIAGKEEKMPEIYVEREYGGYDFFPNCTSGAFETAARTLKDRSASYGADDKDVKDWLAAQDTVFANCASGKQAPAAANAAMPEWLQKDRAYQTAAAAFYSLDYDEAKRLFGEIAQDAASPWRETAEYLVGRTLIRQASLGKDEATNKRLYAEAEDVLYRLANGGGKFGESAQNLLGLIKYRLRPEERVRELAQSLSYQGDPDRFRQNLIDYTWLLDKFEKESLEKEEKRKAALKPKDESFEALGNDPNRLVNTMSDLATADDDDGKLQINLYTDDYQSSWTITLDADATDAEALAEAVKVVGTPLTEKMKEQVTSGRQYSYANRFSRNRASGYQGGYYGEEKPALSILPDFLRYDELTDWLYTYQIKNPEAYLYSLNKFKQSGAELWLVAAISKAEASSSELKYLFEAANRVGYQSPAYMTVQYHYARLLIASKKNEEAKQRIDFILKSQLEMPVSTRNQFMELRQKLADTLEDYLYYAQRRPFAFNYGGEGKSIEEIIAQSKSYYDPQYDQKTRAEYEEEIEAQFADDLLWQERLMFDDRTALIINQYFPLEVLMQAERSAVLPDYLQERFARTALVRALLLGDEAAARKMSAEVSRFAPALARPLAEYLAAAPGDKKYAALYLILKQPEFTPYLTSGTGSAGEANSYTMQWWCEYYDEHYDPEIDQSVPNSRLPKPTFLTAAQTAAAGAEMQKLKALGDAPKYLAAQVFEWAKLAPLDKRVPESLYIVWQANEWNKYSCGSNPELRARAAKLLRARYPNNSFTRQLVDDPEQ